jgi:uncharacterized protein YoaH (UPF0181 family)
MSSPLVPSPTSSSPPPFGYTQIFPSELAVIGEMLGMLESLTNAGQQHVMTKIVGFIQAKVSSGAIARRADRARVAELLDRVKQEAGRPLPVVDAFREAVGSVLAVPGLLL